MRSLREMKYIYPFAKMPRNEAILRSVNNAARRLCDGVRSVDITSIGISDYNKRYFGDYKKDLHRVLQRTGFILAWSISACRKALSQIVFVDYGGGTGCLALLAKELGIGKVIYNDIYDVSCRDARLIAESLGLPADEYVCGDVDELLRVLRQKQLFCDVLASYDVIEHIYDVPSFLEKMGDSSTGPSIIFMASAANTRNPFIRRTLSRMHIQHEHEDRGEKYGHKERDTLRSFYSVRRELIESHSPELSQEVVALLAQNTRGMIKKDIITSVEEYKKTKCFPPKPPHPTNTCDPYTGNWQEQLLEPELLIRSLQARGVTSSIVCGYYGTHSRFLKGLCSLGLNLFISGFGKWGLRVAPFYALYGVNAAMLRQDGASRAVR